MRGGGGCGCGGGLAGLAGDCGCLLVFLCIVVAAGFESLQHSGGKRGGSVRVLCVLLAGPSCNSVARVKGSIDRVCECYSRYSVTPQ